MLTCLDFALQKHDLFYETLLSIEKLLEEIFKLENPNPLIQRLVDEDDIIEKLEYAFGSCEKRVREKANELLVKYFKFGELED